MKCPNCGTERPLALKSFPQFELTIRRRECCQCKCRFTTKEAIISGLDFPPHQGRKRGRDR